METVQSLQPQSPVKRGYASLLNSGFWTIGSYGASQSIRMGSNVILSRLLTPDILGIMVIVNSIRLGVELLTDVGVEQNIIHHRDGLTHRFFNTAWTLQMIRGAFLSVVFLCISKPLADFYHIDPRILFVMSLAPMINSAHSTSVFMLMKTMRVKDRNLFELCSESISFVIAVVLAVSLRNVWALVFASLSSLLVRSLLSYTIPHPAHRLIIDKRYLVDIIHFGKWIVISSLLTYAASNLDRTFLGKELPLQLLGIFGLAKIISDMPAALANRLSYQVVFPAMAAARNDQKGAMPALAEARWKFILAAALALATLASFSDVAIHLLYDARYHAAGWMLFCLLCGAWFAVMSNLNEATLLGFGRPQYNSFSNVVRFGVLLVGLPLGFHLLGLVGAIAALAVAEVCRFVFVSVCQKRCDLSFAGQDSLATLVFAGCLATFCLLRLSLGFGAAWEGIGL